MEEKQKIILQLLSKNPEMSLSEIENALISDGLYGLSLRDKIYILKTQIPYLKVLKDNYEERRNKNLNKSNSSKESKIIALDAKINQWTEQLNQYENDYKTLFSDERKKKNSQHHQSEKKD
eukprot:CAMPEP_0176475330 /NCGR_PEP_ID=MMETSP0127-20121128/43550_1 /TAXON_ID=938130 /ORGANISM="Platyophrya macrostoma, Strain WH" /LENGTH=120 /DNA_ID=CAMNT_0017870921 /DNA_START=252 /DNA_END=614 /DNA_ORIENTATION=-